MKKCERVIRQGETKRRETDNERNSRSDVDRGLGSEGPSGHRRNRSSSVRDTSYDPYFQSGRELNG